VRKSGQSFLFRRNYRWPVSAIEGTGGRVQRRRTLVAQVFGLADATTREPQFDPKFIERVRKMEFPQLMFLPEKAGVFTVDSMLPSG